MIDQRPRSAFKFTQKEYDLYKSGIEIWRDIETWENSYQISTFGFVKSMKRVVIGKRWAMNINEKILKPEVSSAGYLHTTFCRNNKSSKKYNHVLVANAFLQNPENKPQVNHMDLKKSNPRLDNLEFCTGSENVIHSFKNGQSKATWQGKFGKDHPESKPVFQYNKDGSFVDRHECLKGATRKTGICFSSISQVALGKRYSAGGYLWKYECDLVSLP